MVRQVTHYTVEVCLSTSMSVNSEFTMALILLRFACIQQTALTKSCHDDYNSTTKSKISEVHVYVKV